MKKSLEEKIESVYARLPRLDCQKKCQDSCRGTIHLSKVEAVRLRELKVRPGGVPVQDYCPMFDFMTGLCRVHPQRPLVCRLWGLVEKMRCPWGCVPERWLNDEEARALLQELNELEEV
jgi:Fe-S-cluster containining protein